MSNIKDVAKLAGVSTTTVSRVVSKNGYVSSETREIVMKVIEELGYSPSKTASRLARRKHFTIGLVISQRIVKLEKKDGILFSAAGFYSIVFRGIKEKSKKLNMSVKTLILEEERKKISSDCDGYFLLGGDITIDDVEIFKKSHKPVLLVDQHIHGQSLDSVVSDGYDGAISCTNYLINKGYKKIFHIHGPLSHYGFKERYDGYRDSMKSHGFLPRTFLCDDINDDFDLLVPQIFAISGVPDCIFGGNDSIAHRILYYLLHTGYKVPEDMGLVGFDDSIVASVIKPNLSTVKVYRYEMGDVAVERMRQLLYGENIHPIKMSLHTKFIKRESCK